MAYQHEHSLEGSLDVTEIPIWLFALRWRLNSFAFLPFNGFRQCHGADFLEKNFVDVLIVINDTPIKEVMPNVSSMPPRKLVVSNVKSEVSNFEATV
jgi:hypothetical protein